MEAERSEAKSEGRSTGPDSEGCEGSEGRGQQSSARFESASTMLGDLPPSSSETRFRFELLAALATIWPTSVLPVKATLSTSMCDAIAAPAVGP